MGREQERVQVISGKARRTESVGRSRRRLMDNITIDLVEIGCEGVDWIGLRRERDRWRALVNAIMNLRVT
jgi:hypothetical protein